MQQFLRTGRIHRTVRLFVIGILVFDFTAILGVAQIDFEREPIDYPAEATRNVVARLQAQLEEGSLELAFEDDFGYLPSVLDALNVPRSSQMLVFSKTSMQQRHISPSSPRALYFNDNVYVGWVPNGTVIELSAVDSQKGTVFYTLQQEKSKHPRLMRSRGNCLTCHASSRTHNVPGHLVRSVYPSQTGMPHFGAGTFQTNHTSPLEERWGGWYVTGTHGKQRHMGNEIALLSNQRDSLNVERGSNVTDLTDRLETTGKYLTGHSDIIALMVLEHQTELHNLLTFANFETRSAIHYDASMNRILERPKNTISDSTRRRMDRTANKIVKYMLFAEEAPLTDKIQGTSNFAKEFEALGPRDSKGRSLRQFDMERRMFKYPCSYLIYSDAFQELPEQVRSIVFRSLWEILTNKNDSEDFSRLSTEDRKAILEIARETVEGLPPYWKNNE